MWVPKFTFFTDLAVDLYWRSCFSFGTLGFIVELKVFIAFLYTIESLVKALRLAFVNEVFKILQVHSARMPIHVHRKSI